MRVFIKFQYWQRGSIMDVVSMRSINLFSFKIHALLYYGVVINYCEGKVRDDLLTGNTGNYGN